MASTTVPDTTTDTAGAHERRLRGVSPLAGSVLVGVLLEGHVLAFYWFPALAGLTYLTAAAVSRSLVARWTPGLIVLTVGLALALGLRSAVRLPALSSWRWP